MISWDTETFRFRPGVKAPELVCVSYYDGQVLGLEDKEFGLELFEHWLDMKTPMVGQNIAFDMAVMAASRPHLIPKIFEHYRADLVTDTKTRQQLIDIADGKYRGFFVKGNVWVPLKYSLEDLARRHLKVQLDKDTWRMRYSELANLPIDQWPEGAKHYAREDARVTYEVWKAQESRVDILHDQYRRVRAAFSLSLVSVWGLRTDLSSVDKFETEVLRELEEVKADLIQKGLVRADGSRDTKVAKDLMVQVTEGDCPRTKKGGVCLDAEACRASGHPDLENYALYTTLSTLINKDVKALRMGVTYPIHTSFDFAETGRSTSSKPNIQNWTTKKMGVRECFVARQGHVIIQSDYASLELHTLAQVQMKLFGSSRLATVLNSGKDANTMLGATLAGLPYDEAQRLHKSDDKKFANFRKLGKIGNYGLAGGLGIPGLINYAKRKPYDVELTEEQARELKQGWLNTWPEMAEYFAYIRRALEDSGDHTWIKVDGDQKVIKRCNITQLFSKRIRGRCKYTEACNTFFQGLGADATQNALFRVVDACYTNSRSALYGCRAINYIHDEIHVEAPWVEGEDNELTTLAAWEMKKLMEDGANEFLPDVPVRASAPALMFAWSKNAKSIVNEKGLLVPWQ